MDKDRVVVSKEDARKMVIDLAEKLGVDLSTEICKSCEHCYFYEESEEKIDVDGGLEGFCWCPKFCKEEDPEPDDMDHCCHTVPMRIKKLSMASTCQEYCDGKKRLEELLEDEKERFEKFKDEVEKVLRKY